MSAAAEAVRIGDVIADTYVIKRPIGAGGMGAVWEAEHRRLPGKKVAIKFLHAEGLGDDETVARFRREAEIASRLAHRNIVQIHDYNALSDGTPYLVLELLRGESLDQRLARGAMKWADVQTTLSGIGAAMRIAHRAGVIHRDLKPQNVFLCQDDEGIVTTKVLDFGISKLRGSTTIQTQTSMVLGTPQYMAPEQATGEHFLVDERTDIFALGIITYEMLTGMPPFSGANIPEVVFKIVYEPERPIRELISGIDEGAANAVHRALAKKPDDRFPNVDAFLAALDIAVPTTDAKKLDITPPQSAEQSKLGMAETIDSGAKRRSGLHQDGALASTLDSGARAGSPAPSLASPKAGTDMATGHGEAKPAVPPPRTATRRWIYLVAAAAALTAGAAIVMLAQTSPPDSGDAPPPNDPGLTQRLPAVAAETETAAPQVPTLDSDASPPLAQAPITIDGGTPIPRSAATPKPTPASARATGEPKRQTTPEPTAPTRPQSLRPTASQLSRLTAEARRLMEDAIAAHKKGDLRAARSLARNACRVEATARNRPMRGCGFFEAGILCQQRKYGRIANRIRRLPPGKQRARLIRYCESQGALIDL